MVQSEFLPFIGAAALKSTVILGLAALAALWLRRGSAAARHMAWQLGLVAAVALPLASKVLPPLNVLPRFSVPAERDLGSGIWDLDSNTAAPAAVQRNGESASSTAPAQGPAAQQPKSQIPNLISLLKSALNYAVAIWLAGAALVLMRFVLGMGIARWYTRKSRPLDAIEWASLNETMSFAVGLGHPVRLLKSERASTPMTFGVLNPIVLLPADADEWPEERRRIVLLHELAHVHRLDSLTHIFANLACAIYWFNPFVWITAARLRAEAERACDDWVLRAGMRASTYADHLLDMVRTIGRLHTPAVALPMAQRSTFEGRLLAILEPGLNRNGLTRGQALLLTSTIALVVLPLAAMAPAKAASGSGDDIPTSSAIVQDTSKEEQKPERREKRGSIGRAVSDALDNVFNHGKLDKTVSKAIKDTDVDKIVEKTVKDVDIDKIANEAANAAIKGLAGGQQQMSDRMLNALTEALGDSDLEVRRSAVHSLGQAQDPRSVAALSKALREDKDAQVRRSAAWALGNIEDRRGVPALAHALRQDDDVEVRRQAAWALGNIEDASAVEALADAMKDTDREVRAQAVWAMGNIEDRAAVPALTAAVRDNDVNVRKQAVWALGNIEDRASVPALAAALRDSDAGVREQAVWALGNIEVAEAVEPLSTMATDANPRVRSQVAWALGQIESSRAVEPLSRMLAQDSDANVRRQAAWALGQIEDPAAVPALAAALKDADAGVRNQAAWALGQIERRPAPQQLLDALRDSDVGVRRTVVWALGQIEDPNSAAALRAAMKDEDRNVKMGALRALTQIGDEAAYEALAEMLKDPDPAVRRMAAQALGRGGQNWPQPHPQPQPQPRPQPRPRPSGW